MTTSHGHGRMQWFAPVALLSSWAILAGAAQAQVDLEPTWRPATYESTRTQVIEWLREAELSGGGAAEIRALWPGTRPVDLTDDSLLDRVVEAISLAKPQAAELRERCQSQDGSPPLPAVDWLAESSATPFVRDNLRLYYARWLAQQRLYDEALAQLGDLEPADVVDPASLLFYRMIAHHQLVQPDDARAALVALLEHEQQLPRRFQQVAELVQHDLSGLEDESLDHIARRMRDIRRRLDHGRAGAQVQKIERGVVESLDKKIKQAEDQQQQQQQQQAAAQPGGGSGTPSQPMQDSRPAELKAPGRVNRRDIGHETGWGDLPAKDREQALQQIGREFPGHYREVIEQYFRELAAEPTSPATPTEKP